jgi:hypothetical protein
MARGFKILSVLQIFSNYMSLVPVIAVNSMKWEAAKGIHILHILISSVENCALGLLCAFSLCSVMEQFF